uniref:YfcE family phosphodiesterase n=1 Tax=candidate division WOR-3 bacterium TaxID=2052148 RepID=A0A7C4TGQ9_UNCW3
MKLLAISDIHGRTNYSKEIFNILTEVDVVIISGDITNFGGKKEARFVLNEIKKFNSFVLAVPGNCDLFEVIEVLKEENINLHGEIKEFNGLIFFGIGGSGYTPFRTPQEYSDKEIEKILENYEKRGGVEIFVTHTPPINTKVDKTLLGIQAGSDAIRTFIEDKQPDLCLCGHIHEAKGIDYIGRTIVVNPGPFPKNYALIEITEKITVKLMG